MRQHANRAHNKKRVADEDICQVVRSQSWFGERRERYWIVDESRRVDDDDGSDGSDDGDDGDDDHTSDSLADHQRSTSEVVDDQIVQDIEQYQADAKQRRLHADMALLGDSYRQVPRQLK